MKETSIRKGDKTVRGLIALASVLILASTLVKFNHAPSAGQREVTPSPTVPVPDPGHTVRVDEHIPDTMKRWSELQLLAETLLLEAAGEGRKGMMAVANVIVNRMRDPRWPDTVFGVVMQPHQFSCWNNERLAAQRLARIPERVRKEAMRIAAMALNGTLPTMTHATHYHAVSVQPSWARHSAFLGRIGRHKFYRL